jgi:hypothetical protein
VWRSSHRDLVSGGLPFRSYARVFSICGLEPSKTGLRGSRLFDSFTSEELETCASGGGFPDSLPNRPSSLDTLDRKSLLKLWEEDERVFEGRSKEELDFYADNGSWPEATGRLHYFLQDGKLFVEWRSGPGEKVTESGSTPGLEWRPDAHYGFSSPT